MLALTREPRVDVGNVAALLEKDPVLAGHVLKVAQSPIYRGQYPLASLRDALVRLGLQTMCDILMSVSMQSRVFRSPHFQKPMTDLLEHSTATAHMARVVCRYASLDGEFAFLCGLFHDVGAAASILLIGDVPRGKKPPEFMYVWPAIEQVHEQASDWLVGFWELPNFVKTVVANHHSFTVKGEPHPMAAVVCLADALATQLGKGFESEVDEFQSKRAADYLNVSAATINKILEEGARLFAPAEDDADKR